MPSHRLVLAIDQGTSNTKAVLVDASGTVVGQASRPMDIQYPQPGWVQQDAAALWQTVRECIDEVLQAAGGPDLAAIGISNQRESGLAWERTSGAPVGPVVTWQCRRSAALCDWLRGAGRAHEIQARTGLPLDPGFTAGKWRWLLDATDDGPARAAAGDIRLGTVDSWLLWNLTGGVAHATDASNASRTQLMDLSKVAWDPWLAEAFGLPLAALPQIMPSSTHFGETIVLGNLPAGVPIGSLVGDSHAALFGHAGFEPGSIKATYGTGSSLMMPTPTQLSSDTGLAATVAWGLDSTTYALEGNINVTGAAVQWLADFIGLAGPAAVAELAAATPGTEGIYLVPAFVGLGAPHWDDQARGLISGLTRGSSREQLARAAVDSIAYQVRDVFDAMQAASGGSLRLLMADGGVTRNEQLMQFQADILGVPVQRNNTAELSAMGAAYLAGLAAGIWGSTEEIAALPRSVDRFDPKMPPDERERLYDGWQDAIARTTLHP
ncbi:MAG TPA: FGGY-family carbohydrate kinase [Anaerolineae bacterium]|nr:FGGY-family carbohydrate kinase [Anaerolineae bacterium]